MKVCFLLTIFLCAFRLNAEQLFVLRNQIVARPTSFFKCFLSSGFTKMGLYYFSSGFNIEQSQAVISNIYNAKNAGLSVQVIFIPCNKYGVEKEISSIIKIFGEGLITKFWVVPYFSEQQSPECAIGSLSPLEKCKYLQNLVQAFEKYRLDAQMIGQRSEWEKQFNTIEGCPQLGRKQLWWQPEDEQVNDQPNFDNFVRFGGWHNPYMKMLKTQRTVWGQQFIANYKQ